MRYLDRRPEASPRFVDLNFDAARSAPRGRFTSFRELWLSETVLSAYVIISMPKIKTRHWAGLTLSWKNPFGCVPGNPYGWPENVLNWEGIGKIESQNWRRLFQFTA